MLFNLNDWGLVLSGVEVGVSHADLEVGGDLSALAQAFHHVRLLVALVGR